MLMMGLSAWIKFEQFHAAALTMMGVLGAGLILYVFTQSQWVLHVTGNTFKTKQQKVSPVAGWWSQALANLSDDRQLPFQQCCKETWHLHRPCRRAPCTADSHTWPCSWLADPQLPCLSKLDPVLLRLMLVGTQAAC